MTETTQTAIREHVLEVFREILSDPDYGQELDKKFLKKLEKSIAARKKGETVSFDDVVRKYVS